MLKRGGGKVVEVGGGTVEGGRERVNEEIDRRAKHL